MRRFSRVFRVFIVLGILFIFSCENEADDIPYPHTEHKIVPIGSKSGLTDSSSETDFYIGLVEIMTRFKNEHSGEVPGVGDTSEYYLGGVAYNVSNTTSIITVPNPVLLGFWENIEKEDYSVGSCWGFVHYDMPAKGAIGKMHSMFVIIKSMTGAILYISQQGDITPR